MTYNEEIWSHYVKFCTKWNTAPSNVDISQVFLAIEAASQVSEKITYTGGTLGVGSRTMRVCESCPRGIAVTAWRGAEGAVDKRGHCGRRRGEEEETR